MLMLHALWSSGSTLWLWGEDPAAARAPLPKPAAKKRGSGGTRPAAPPPHPFAADPGRLREEFGLDAPDAPATLLLPSAPRRPFPSGPFAPRARATPRLRPWRVPVLVLDAAGAVATLPSLRGGVSVGYLAQAVQLALELVARGRVLPGLVRDEGGHVARWSPAPTPSDAARLGLLVRAMPPACRAEALRPEDARQPADIVSNFVSSVVDTVVRAALASSPLVAPRRGRPPRSIGAGEAFARALTAPDPGPTVEAEPGEVDKLERALREWHAAGVRPEGPVRTCFRLCEPVDAAWRVEFLLQSTSDPSLLVPAEEVWSAGRRLPLPKETVADAAECLLGDLGHATRLYPELERALDGARPTELVLDAAGAHTFLAHAAALLERAGFGVIVPAWWRSGSSRLGVRLRAATRDGAKTSSGLLGVDGLCDYRWEVALGDESLSAKDLRALARAKVPLVRVKGRWTELRPEDIAQAMRLLEQPAGEMTAGDVLRVGLGLEPSPAGLPVVDVQADGWLGELLSSNGDRRVEPMPTPDGFEGRLRPYQERGLAWLSFLDGLGLGACLADDMGLGKTCQLLALLLAERCDADTRPAPTLLVCPMSVVGNWQREAERFTPELAVHVHHGTARAGGRAFTTAARRADLVLTTYALAARDGELLSKVKWGRVVLDEAQAVKNASSKQAQAVRALPSARRVALTGTPVENRLSELWSIMDFLNPGLLGSPRSFRERFAMPIERFRDDEAAALLTRVTGPFILRRLKTDRSIIADLPDKIEMKVFCNLTREQATLYQAVVDDMLARIETSEGIERKGLVLATMVKLKQVCNHPTHLLGDGSRLDGRSGKLARLVEVLEEVVAEGDRALVFTQFAEMGHLLRPYLADVLGADVPFLYGGVTKRARDDMVAAFQSPGGPPVLLASLKAGGVGLNLTAANHVVHFDRWWNPAVEDQATDRAFRIGQHRNVQVRKFVCAGTLEERIDRMIEDKRELAERIVGTGEAWLTELSTTDLRELVALGSDAVAEG